MTTDRIAELRELTRQVTPGPWEAIAWWETVAAWQRVLDGDDQ